MNSHYLGGSASQSKGPTGSDRIRASSIARALRGGSKFVENINTLGIYVIIKCDSQNEQNKMPKSSELYFFTITAKLAQCRSIFADFCF